MPTQPDDDFTELVDANIDRVDLVDKAANGLPFLMAKQAEDGGPAGLIDPGLIRGLIGKGAEPDPTPAPGETVTMTGSPGAIARLIHEAAVRKTTDSIAKDADMATPADLDPTVVLAEPDGTIPGNADVPGSPAWEAVDAATARKWTSILSRAKTALGVMVERELLEPGDGTPDDYDGVMDLSDASCAIDYAISLLAPFAVDEQAEADCGAEMAAVGKALGGFDPAPLDVLESLGQVRKAGRSLSAANELAIRQAVESLQKVLASLPVAPDPQEGGQEVAKKETDMEPQTAPEIEASAVDPVGKADGEGDGDGGGGSSKAPLAVVYDAKGRIVGIVDPDQITPVSGVEAPDDEDEAPKAPAEPEPEAMDLEPAPADEVGIPADEDVAKATDPAAPATDASAGDVVKTTDEDVTATGGDVTKTTDDDSDVSKSSITELVKGILDEHSATQTDLITKQGAAVLELAELIKGLQGQVRTLEEQPAVPGVFSQGAVPPAPVLRGQDRGAAAQNVDPSRVAELKKALHAGTAAEQNDAAVAMQTQAIAALQEIHQQRA